ncbi:hypothetical protein JW905_12815 [bacterium]|nr:hypothetical protein [candidate division CSSED10-310 bacterium]
MMRLKGSCWLLIVAMVSIGVPAARAGWTFAEINYSPGAWNEDDGIESISWRPQGDYALIAGSEYLFRYEYPDGPLSYQSYPGLNMDLVEWAPDGSYALLTGGTHIYRYEHAETGFGTVTELTSIQRTSPTDTVTFYDIAWNPAEPTALAYVISNYHGSSHQIRMYRYEPGGTPYELAYDFSGGTTYAWTSEYIPISMAFQADGDYIVIANKTSSYAGVFVFDPDQSTFPKEPSGAMQFFDNPGDIGNACAVTMSPISGTRFVLLKGSGDVQRLTQTGLPPTFVFDAPGSPSMTDYRGDADYSGNGLRAVVVERQAWTPYHRIATFDENGDQAGGIDLIGLPEQRLLRIDAVDWHPTAPMGLMAGEDRWMIRFETDEIPTPDPTLVPVPSATSTPSPSPTQNPTMTPSPSASPTAPVIPATGTNGLGMLGLFMSLLLLGIRRNSFQNDNNSGIRS